MTHTHVKKSSLIWPDLLRTITEQDMAFPSTSGFQSPQGLVWIQLSGENHFLNLSIEFRMDKETEEFEESLGNPEWFCIENDRWDTVKIFFFCPCSKFYLSSPGISVSKCSVCVCVCVCVSVCLRARAPACEGLHLSSIQDCWGFFSQRQPRNRKWWLTNNETGCSLTVSVNGTEIRGQIVLR